MNIKNYALQLTISIIWIALLSSAYPSLYEEAMAQEEEEKEKTGVKCSPEADEDSSKEQQCVPEKGDCPSDDTLIVDQDEERRTEFLKENPDIADEKTTGIPYEENVTTEDGNHSNETTVIAGIHSNLGHLAIC
jgi:hypothetical protein